MRISVFYQIVSVLLSIISFLFLLGSLINIFTIGAQPIVLITFFIILAVVIYLTLCFKLTRIINQQLALQRRTKDWIKVNGFVGLLFCVLMILGSLNFLINPQIIDKIFALAASRMQGFRDINFLKNVFRSIIIGMLIYAILLMIHIISSLIYINRYSKLQQNQNKV